MFSDTDLPDSHSVGGYVCLYDGCIVAWVSKRQTRIALSTTESESMASIPGAKHALWIRHLLQELGLPCTEPIHIYYDNMQNIQDASHHPCTKHFRVEGHWVRELVDHGDAEMTYARSAENITDILTKSLPLAQHKFLVHKLGML